MSCGCSSLGNDGKGVADLVRGKGFENMPTKVNHTIVCSCGDTFVMDKLVCKCPKCNMTYTVTPCSSDNKENIKACGIDY
ncbi:hypothetical protein [Clostridium sardiniense]|uniref:hypothetical protein n=1 Tax=Clostridium sardiniense TaxID=29369 RepID=UPI001956ADE9|nr:hypothetical protein [Clostridium sardiniense]MBM7836180.1 hypothetical protein [Clostridium sardiniense]